MTENFKGVRIVKIISESKKRAAHAGFRRVQAIVRINGGEYTRHGDTEDGKFLIMKPLTNSKQRAYSAEAISEPVV